MFFHFSPPSGTSSKFNLIKIAAISSCGKTFFPCSKMARLDLETRVDRADKRQLTLDLCEIRPAESVNGTENV